MNPGMLYIHVPGLQSLLSGQNDEVLQPAQFLMMGEQLTDAAKAGPQKGQYRPPLGRSA